MKHTFTLILCLLPLISWAQIPIYDIQHTTIPGANDTYPSLYNGQTVTTEGIVTVANFNGGRYFISSPEGGAWNGIFIYDNTNSPSVGDKIRITGMVYEYDGMTEIKDLTSFDVLNVFNTLPAPTAISPDQVTEEAYEGVVVKVTECTVSQTYDQYGNWKMNSGDGEYFIRNAMYDLRTDLPDLHYGYPFASVTGIIGHYYTMCLLPRGKDDIQVAKDAFILSFDDMCAEGKATIELPINVSLPNQTANINSYEINLTYDETVFKYEGYSLNMSLPEHIEAHAHEIDPNRLKLTFNGKIICSNTVSPITLKFTPLKSGNANLKFDTSNINGQLVSFVSNGDLSCSHIDCGTPQADMVSVIQRPLLNIPSIVAPGETFTIECFAPETTTEWDAELIFGEKLIDLNISHASYDVNLEKWTLKATIPSVEFYELYDLKVTASNGISDTVSNSVKVIDSYKNDYYFVQITDTHLLGHSFCGRRRIQRRLNTEMDDLNEVIKDINLINPEFVLLTGDLLNEGEMENFECLRNHTKTIQLLEKFEVPVYIVPGNHDLGGWVSTPPLQGTARKEWWRFFGWNHKTGYPTQEEYYVHDYSFDYGNVHFAGLESSDNYDSYMYEVYGEKGFIPSQLTWLENDLSAAGDKTKVLFYHYDFNHELDLSKLGVDMALWGHTHKNTDDFTHPYNIGTDNVCDGEQAYRVIRVNNGKLTPKNTLYVQDVTQNLDVVYNSGNSDPNNVLSATLTNHHNQAFSNALIKFEVPGEETEYLVENGTLKQVHSSNGTNTCYVNVNLDANSEITVNIKKNVTNALNAIEANGGLEQCFPNPFRETTQISFKLKKRADVKLLVYNVSGQLTNTLINETQNAGAHTVTWNGTDEKGNKVANGTYFYRFIVNGKQVSSRHVIYTR